MWKYLSQVTKPEDCGRPDEFDLCVDTTVAPPAGSWLEQPYQPGKRQWSCPGWDVKQLALDNNLEEETSTPLERQRERRVLVQEWLDSLDDRGYDELRRKATHREGHLLRDEGFWNAMSEELSPSAVSFIRDEGTFYHLFPDNPNAVEWGIFWLRLLRTSANKLKKFKGGTASLVEQLTARLQARTHVTLRPAQEVLEVAPGSGERPIRLKIHDRRDGREYTMEADHCVLALPLAPTVRLASAFPVDIRERFRPCVRVRAPKVLPGRQPPVVAKRDATANRCERRAHAGAALRAERIFWDGHVVHRSPGHRVLETVRDVAGTRPGRDRHGGSRTEEDPCSATSDQC